MYFQIYPSKPWQLIGFNNWRIKFYGYNSEEYKTVFIGKEQNKQAT